MDIEDLRRQAKKETTASDILTELAKFEDNEIALAIVKHKNASFKALEQLVVNQYYPKQPADFYYKIINRPNISPKILDLIIRNCQYSSVRRLVLKHPATSLTTLERFMFFRDFIGLYKDFMGNRDNYNLLVNHPNVSLDIIRVVDFINLDRNLPYSDQNISQGILDELSQYAPDSIGDSIFQYPNRGLTAFDEVKDKIPQAIVDNPLLNLLLIHNPESKFIKLALAENSQTPIEILNILVESEDRDVLINLVCNPDIPALILDKIANFDDDFLHSFIAQNPNTSGEILSNLVEKSTDITTLREVAQNPNTPQETIDYLKENSSYLIRIALAKNSQISEATALFLIKDSSRKVRKYLAINLNISLKIIETLARDRSSYVQVGVAKNPHTPPEILAKLATSEDCKVRRGVAENPQATLQILKRLKQDEDRLVLAKLANNPSISFEIMEYLAEKAIAFVRQELAKNPQVPAIVLDKLKGDYNEKVLQYLVKNPNISLATLKQLSNHKKKTIAKVAREKMEHSQKII
ncbi:hypothetical protein H1P_1870015 [Hyella patelloides LEGE 07179]|uniref:Leucine rich repeat variant n=1 Tax=Hyella patelloides LEGE 07179 TaxID=945734 RepID=A0A563VP35_9CYAN|nr:hypothetical protein [Hyella patelloides]VEP13171.1 hypothetical protein H1P_1870015 [Hyella patelloides LEGE 07179]